MKMVEKIAVAIFYDRYPDKAWGELRDTERLSYEGHARAAVEAMMEPDRKMLATGVIALIDAGLDGRDGVGPREAEAAYQAMLRAILDEE